MKAERILSILLAILLVATTVYSVETLERQENTIKSLKLELNQKQQQVESLSSLVDSLEVNLTQARLEIESKEQRIQSLEGQNRELKAENQRLKKVTGSRFSVVGVNAEGRGSVIPLTVEIHQGSGKLFLNVASAVLGSHLQISAQNAVHVAREIARADLSRRDISISIEAPRSEEVVQISGESGGAAMTLAVLAALEERNISQDVLITGAVKTDHRIGRVGEVKAKAIAAKEHGAKIFLVPRGQMVEVEGLEVREVSTIEEAARYVLV